MEQQLEVLEFINDLEKEGIKLWQDNGALKYRGPKEKMTKDIIHFLKSRKQEVIDCLEEVEQQVNSGFNLTPIQHAYIMGGENDCELGNTNAHYYIEYDCPSLDIKRLERVVNNAILRNDALRLVFSSKISQRVLERVPYYTIEVYHVSTEEELFKLRYQWSHHHYQLNQWPLFHFMVSKNEYGAIRLHVSFDCIILDAMSAKMLLEEIFSEYNGKNIKDKDYSFEKYMRSLEDYIEDKVDFSKAESYWDDRIKEMPKAPHLQIKKEMSLVEKPRFTRIEHRFTKDETVILYENIKKYNLTPAAVICTVFMTVLSHYSSNEDISLNLTLFHRFQMNKQVNNILGDFTNVGFASYLAKKNTHFLGDIKEVQKQFWKLVQFRSYDGTKILKKLSKGEIGKAIMPVVFTCILKGDLNQQTHKEFEEIYSLSQTPQIYIDHHVRDDLGYLKISWDYVEELFDEEVIKSMFLAYEQAIRGIIVNKNWDEYLLKIEN